MSNTNIKNIDTVSFGNSVINTTLSSGFDGKAPDKHKRDISLSFELSDDTKVKEFLMDRLAAAMRIKVNQSDGYLKGMPGVVDAESYADKMDEHDCEFHFSEQDVIDLLTPSKRTPSKMTEAEMVDQMYKDDKIDKSQHEQMMAIIEANEG